MPKQLNIRSDEAYEIAHELAQRLNRTVTEVLETALREYRRGQTADVLTPEEAAFLADIQDLSSRAAAAARPGVTSDHRDFYDDKGLPA
jgi:hypothetical protein